MEFSHDGDLSKGINFNNGAVNDKKQNWSNAGSPFAKVSGAISIASRRLLVKGV